MNNAFDDTYTPDQFYSELNAFFNSRLFTTIESFLLADMTQKLLAIPASDYTALVTQKRNIEALNALIGTMRSIKLDQTLEDVNAANTNQFA